MMLFSKLLMLKLLPFIYAYIFIIITYRYIQLGMKVTKIHRVLSFDQTPFMAPYINKNSKLRMEASNDFEKISSNS